LIDLRRERAVRGVSRRRLLALLLVLTLAFVGVVGRLAIVQGFSARAYAAIGFSERVHTENLPADRGSIFDAEGDELAMSVPQSSVWADPALITAPADEAKKLAPVLGLPEDVVLGRLTGPGQFAYVERTVSDATAKAVKALDLPGIGFVDEPKRFDPDGPLAAPLIGQVGTDDEGLSGLEYQYNTLLAGRPGKLESEEDPTGQPIPGGIQRLTPATKGSDLVLTLDRSLEYEVEQDLGKQIIASKAKGGMAIVMNTHTGAVTAIANLVQTADGTGWQPAPTNAALTTVFEPGSVQKLITVSAAIQEGVIKPTTVMTIPDHVEFYGTMFRDDTSHPVEQWTPTDVLTASSNIGALTIARRLGEAGLIDFMHKFGEGSGTDLHFPGESSGLIPAPADWSGTTIDTVAFGQGLAVTAVQLAAAYNTVANGGVYVAPKLVSGTIDSHGHIDPTPPSPTHRVISAQVAREITAMLTEVTRGGTGTEAAIDGYQVAGKTGTAKKAVGSVYQTGAYYASFAGFVPATAPAFTAFVVLDQPANIFGGVTAAPVFHDIATYALRELQVPPPPPDPGLFAGVPHAQPSAATAADEPSPAGASFNGSTSAGSDGLIDPPPPAFAPPTTTTSTTTTTFPGETTTTVAGGSGSGSTTTTSVAARSTTTSTTPTATTTTTTTTPPTTSTTAKVPVATTTTTRPATTSTTGVPVTRPSPPPSTTTPSTARTAAAAPPARLTAAPRPAHPPAASP